IGSLVRNQTNHLCEGWRRIANNFCFQRKPTKSEGAKTMTRSCRFYSSRLFIFFTASVLIGLTLIGAAQQKPAANGIAGRVLGDDGHPLVNADVGAFQVAPPGSKPVYRMTRTDDEGFFRLTNLPSGEYQLSANAEGYLQETARASERPDDNKFQPGASVTITLK